jgi:hypothetical protein
MLHWRDKADAEDEVTAQKGTWLMIMFVKYMTGKSRLECSLY